eukprot:m.35672 g.35672  ORF g.35672 m.35672 type:complete len:116 (+) comp17182_c0_seq1:268-615(+)
MMLTLLTVVLTWHRSCRCCLSVLLLVAMLFFVVSINMISIVVCWCCHCVDEVVNGNVAGGGGEVVCLRDGRMRLVCLLLETYLVSPTSPSFSPPLFDPMKYSPKSFVREHNTSTS